ncbi:radical SAM protein [bacterium]|nr:radical SAM protein [bacterium]
MEEKRLQVTEIFYSIQGESTHAGRLCIFIRLTGCPLRCRYCDTAYAYSGGNSMSVEEIFSKVKSFDCSLVEVTGGEPLLQQNTIHLLNNLLQDNYEVLLETSGAVEISSVPDGVKRIVDFKCPDSGESKHNLFHIIDDLRAGDEVKFVIASKNDYEWTRSVVSRYPRLGGFPLLLSPAVPNLSTKMLAEWMLEDNFPARLQIQLHKIVGLDERIG